MGFFRWLFGMQEKKVVSNQGEFIPASKPVERPERRVEVPSSEVHKPAYKTVPRTKESSSYVNDILRKANSADTLPKPQVDNSDPSQIERLTNKLKAEYSNKK